MVGLEPHGAGGQAVLSSVDQIQWNASTGTFERFVALDPQPSIRNSSGHDHHA